MDAKIKKTIMIIGMMGSGKSSIGRRIAAHYNLPFIDSDKEVEKAAYCSVKDFFELYGADEFHRCEHRVIERLLNGDICILSSGRDAFLHPETRALAKKKAITVWLRADEELLYKRLKGQDRRPQIPQDPEALKGVIANFLAVRTPIYSEADLTIESLDESSDKTAKRVINALDLFLMNNKK